MKCRTIYHRLCRNCGKEFTTNISTIYCCCTECRKAFSETNRNLSYTISAREAKLNKERARLSSKDYLSITQAAKLLGVSRPTIYKRISLGDIQVIRLSPRSVRIRRSDILPEPPKPVHVSPHAILLTPAQIAAQYAISESWFYKKIKTTGIRPVRQKGRSYYLQSDVQPVFQRRNDERWLLDKWSTVAELSAESGLSPKYIRELIRIHRIPKKKAGRSIIVSYRHWTDLRELEPLLKREYITAFKARAHYHATSDTVCRAIREHNIPKLRHGNSVYYKLSDLDKYLLNRK